MSAARESFSQLERAPQISHLPFSPVYRISTGCRKRTWLRVARGGRVREGQPGFAGPALAL